jgi:hypothetical protein
VAGGGSVDVIWADGHLVEAARAWPDVEFERVLAAMRSAWATGRAGRGAAFLKATRLLSVSPCRHRLPGRCWLHYG